MRNEHVCQSRKSVKIFARSNGRYTALYKNIPLPFSAMVMLPAESLTTGESSGSRPQEEGAETKKLALNSGEQLYAELRDKNFSAVGSLLSRKAKLISAQFDVS